MLHDPQLLIVDEPTVGLDPEERTRFRNLLSDLSGALFVPSLALALGVLIGNSKAFEVVYISLMYLVFQKVVPLDFVGMTPESPWYIYAPLAIVLLALAFMARQRQLATNNASR